MKSNTVSNFSEKNLSNLKKFARSEQSKSHPARTTIRDFANEKGQNRGPSPSIASAQTKENSGFAPDASCHRKRKRKRKKNSNADFPVGTGRVMEISDVPLHSVLLPHSPIFHSSSSTSKASGSSSPFEAPPVLSCQT